ncbi:hypothetical protein [Microbacterium sp. NPDC090014]|uniref:hypothetical protein n=1 Tax=Microbacterium sp. NPDC090014 TaxID=3364205 RepID=UPI003811BFCF
MTSPPLRPLSVLAIRHGRGGGAAVPRLGGRIVAVAVLALGAGALAGCTTEPEPAPTPTAAFASEEEAFAAAEKVYRAYNEALNDRRKGVSGADPQQYLTGVALESDIDGQNVLRAEGLRIEGTAEVTSFAEESAELQTDHPRVVSLVCIDVSGVSLMSEAGVNVTPPERGDIVAQRVEFVVSTMSLVIAHEATAETTTC